MQCVQNTYIQLWIITSTLSVTRLCFSFERNKFSIFWQIQRKRFYACAITLQDSFYSFQFMVAEEFSQEEKNDNFFRFRFLSFGKHISWVEKEVCLATQTAINIALLLRSTSKHFCFLRFSVSSFLQSVLRNLCCCLRIAASNVILRIAFYFHSKWKKDEKEIAHGKTFLQTLMISFALKLSMSSMRINYLMRSLIKFFFFVVAAKNWQIIKMKFLKVWRQKTVKDDCL